MGSVSCYYTFLFYLLYNPYCAEQKGYGLWANFSTLLHIVNKQNLFRTELFLKSF
jgi:hypothetical protein